MAITGESTVVSFDGDAAFDAARDVAGSDLYSFVEYDMDDYNVIYLSDPALAMYESEAQAFDHFDQVHSHVHLDFTEIDLFTEGLFPVADEVRYVTTAMDFLKIVRIYNGDEGIFVSLSPDTDEGTVVDAVRDHMTEP